MSTEGVVRSLLLFPRTDTYSFSCNIDLFAEVQDWPTSFTVTANTGLGVTRKPWYVLLLQKAFVGEANANSVTKMIDATVVRRYNFEKKT